jgi:hypothetical protein
MRTKLFLIILVFSSLTSNAQNKLLGEWKTQITADYAMTMVLKANSECLFDGMPCTYTYTSNTLTLKEGSDIRTDYQYAISGNQLTLTNQGIQMIFTKQGTKGTPTNNVANNNTKNVNKTNPGNNNVVNNNTNNKVSNNTNSNKVLTDNKLIGKWSGNGEIAEFRENGTTNFAGNELTYTVKNDILSITTAQGVIPFKYKISNGQLTMQYNDKSYSYYKIDGTNTFPPGAVIAPELVNKWCFVKTSNSNGVQKVISSSSECISLYANGTYEYFYEGGTTTQTFSTASQEYDKGTWRATKDMVFVISEKTGFQSYNLQKVNNSNNDPMIVLGGRSFVSYSNKPAW